MGHTLASSAKRSRNQAVREQPSKAKPPHSTSVPAATLKALKTLVQRHSNGDRTASWELGRSASQLLGHTAKKPAPRTAIADLAEKIGLIQPPDPASPEQRRDESNFRQLMKFGRIATKSQARALGKAGVAWRGIVIWIGVDDDDHREELYREMVRGLTNSTQVRAYIETNFKKKPLPRFSGDCAEDFRKAQDQADTLASVLGGLCNSLDKHEEGGSARQRRQLSKALENARTQISATMRKIRK